MTRKEAIRTLETESCYECSYGCESPTKCTCPKCNLIDAIKVAIEALREQRPHSELLQMITKDDYGEQVLGYKCKTCGWLKSHDKMPFCENCGADMRKEGDT